MTMQMEEGRGGSETPESELQERLRKTEDAYRHMEKEKNEVIRVSCHTFFR